MVLGLRLNPLPASIRDPALAEITRLYDEYQCWGLRPDCVRWETDRVVKERMLAAAAKVVSDAEEAGMLLPKPPRHRLPR